MNTQFDYYQFLKNKRIKYDVKIDLSGLEVKSDASMPENDDTGKVDDVNLAEITDENVNFVYTHAQGTPGLKFSYYPKDDNGKLIVDEYSGGDAKVEIRTVGEPVTEVDLIDFDANPNPRTINLYGSNIAGIIPRHLLFNQNTRPIMEKGIFGALGIYGTNKYNINDGVIADFGNGTLLLNDLGFSDAKIRKAYFTKKQFYKRINAIIEQTEQNAVEITTKEYKPKLNEAGEDVNLTGMMPFFNFYIDRYLANAFIDKKMTDGGMDYIAPDDVTPFHMSVKEAFKAYFDSKDELYDDFFEAIRSIVDAINGNKILNAFVDDDDLGLDKRYVIDETNTGVAYYKDSDGNPTASYDLIVNPVADGNRPAYAKYATETVNGVVCFIVKKDSRSYEREYVLDDENVNAIILALPSIRKQVNRAVASMTAYAFISAGIGASALAYMYEAVDTIKDNLRALKTIIKKIRWYQHFTNESVFPSREFIFNEIIKDGDEVKTNGFVKNSEFRYDKIMARLIVPVYWGKKKVKVKRKIFGRKYTTYRKVDQGIRFIEVNFLDVNVYTQYRKNNTPLGKKHILNIPIPNLVANGSIVNATLNQSLPFEIMKEKPLPEHVMCEIASSSQPLLNGTYTGKIINSNSIQYELPEGVVFNGNYGSAMLVAITTPFASTKPDDTPKNIKMLYVMPHLPFDSELRRKAFEDFGPFDQSKYANKNRSGDYKYDIGGNLVQNSDVTGWEIFHESSKSIQMMRSGIDIYNKTQFLLELLNAEFGESRVHLIETTRSFKDQEKLQLGGDVSNFLSWHNYGLSVKIRITQLDGMTAIEDGTPDSMKLLDISEAFSEGVKLGYYGTPLNVIWCGQLVTGPDIFVWEFLPIGVNHKDAIKFRDAVYAQKDPVAEYGYINATSNGFIVSSGSIPSDDTPYVTTSSKAVSNGITIGNSVWVDPKKIYNYVLPSNLILKDIMEYLMLVNSKMKAHGTTLMGRKLVSEWKASNPISFGQLVLFYSLTGNYPAARGLLSGDYIERFQNIINTFYKTNPIKFVKQYLGDQYYNIRIYLDDLPDGSYITLHDGLMTTPILEARSSHPEGNGNTFGQKQIDYNNIEFGQYKDGVFIPEGDEGITYIKTGTSVISGYDDFGNPYSGDALILHSLICNQIYTEYNEILDAFNKLNIKFMYDSFYQSPNKSSEDLLENEFGVIKSQDILTFDQLRDMYSRIAINSKKTDGDGTVRGAGANLEDSLTGDESVYEKLVSTSQIIGARRAKLTKEKPIIEPLQNGLTVEKIFSQLKKGSMPKVSDIL